MICKMFVISSTNPQTERTWEVLSQTAKAPLLWENDIKMPKFGGTWVAQSIKRPTSAQVMISPSVLTAQSLVPALNSVSLSLSAPPLLLLCPPLSLSKNK